jgi:ribosomal protein S27AE
MAQRSHSTLISSSAMSTMPVQTGTRPNVPMWPSVATKLQMQAQTNAWTSTSVTTAVVTSISEVADSSATCRGPHFPTDPFLISSFAPIPTLSSPSVSPAPSSGATTVTVDVLGEIISAENEQLHSSLFHKQSSLKPALTIPALVKQEGERLKPGHKRCPSCLKSAPVRASKCPHCDYCFYLTVSPHTPSQQVGKGHKMCPTCGEVCAAKRSRCAKCEYVFFSTKRYRATETTSLTAAATTQAVTSAVIEIESDTEATTFEPTTLDASVDSETVGSSSSDSATDS